MANYYKDEAGHFTSKENDGGPCRHKRINNGKYEYSEDEGKSWKAFNNRDEYDKYEAKSWDFDENNDDDFGFDEDEVLDVGLQSYHLDEIQSLADSAQEDFDMVRDRFVEEINDMMKDGYDLEDAYAVARDNYIDEKGLDEHPEPEEDDNINEKRMPDESKRVKMGVDSQNRTYVQSSDGNRQYFASEKEAKDYADRMNEAQGFEESSPMNEFSGPEGSELSYAQTDANFNKGLTVDAPEKGQGWKKTKMASGTLYEGPNGEREMDDLEMPSNEEIEKQRKIEERAKLDKQYPERGDAKLEKEIGDILGKEESSEKKGLVKDTLVDKFDDAHLYNDGGKFQLALSDGTTKEFNSKNEAIDYLSNYSKRDYSWAKDKTDNKEFIPDDTARNVARVFLNQKFGYDENFLKNLTDEDLDLAAKFFKKFNIDNLEKKIMQGK